MGSNCYIIASEDCKGKSKMQELTVLKILWKSTWVCVLKGTGNLHICWYFKYPLKDVNCNGPWSLIVTDFPWNRCSGLTTWCFYPHHELIISSSYLSLWWRDILQMYQFLRGLFVCFYFMFGFLGGFLGVFFPPWIDSLSHFWEHQDLTKGCSSFESSSKHRGYWLEIPFSVCPSQWITGITPVGSISIF